MKCNIFRANTLRNTFFKNVYLSQTMRGSAINKHTLSWCLAALCVIKIILDYELSTNPLYVLKSYKFSKEFAVKARLQERQRIFDALYGEQNRLDWLGNAYGDLFRESARNFKRFRRPHRQEVEDFVEQRDRGWRRQGDESSFASCGNCVLNASCYDATKSLWHPSKCSSNSGLFQFKPGNVASSHERCSNLSLVFLGDSRARYLFSAVMRRFYPEWIKIHRLNKEGTFNDTFPLGILNLSHPRWEKVVGYLSSHLWNYREPEIFGNETDPDFQVIPRRRFYSYWDHHLNASKATLRSILSEVRPAALVFTAGPWFSWHQDADFGWFATNMNRTLNNLVELKKEFSFQPILYLSETIHSTMYHISTENLLKMNWIAVYLVQNHFKGEVVVWDSHLALQRKYKLICLKYHMQNDPKRVWSCEDKLHSGTVVLDHFAQMLLNYICPV